MSIPFSPRSDQSIKVTMNGASVATATAIAGAGGSPQVRVCNLSTGPVWVKFGVSGLTADVTNDMPIPAGGVEVFTIQPESAARFAAAIGSGAGDVWFTLGDGE